MQSVLLKYKTYNYSEAGKNNRKQNLLVAYPSF